MTDENRAQFDMFLDVLVTHGYLKGKHFIPKDLSKKHHGSCCYCQTCGMMHDECVCSHNELLEALYKALQK